MRRARGRAGGTDGPSVTVVYWRDIPAQVIARDGAETAKRELSERFQKAIDACAMRVGARDDEAYLADWRRGAPQPCDAALDAAADAVARQIEDAYDGARLNRLIGTGGIEPAEDRPAVAEEQTQP